MAEELRLKTTKEPTFFNEDAFNGFMILPVIGGIVGAMYDKNRMEKDVLEGKKVSSDPSIFNKGMMTGLFIGSLI